MKNMKAYDAYCIALKNPEFKAMCNKIQNRVENGDSHTSAFHFIVDGQRFYFGYESMYDIEANENVIAPFYGKCGRRNGPGANLKPIVVR